VQAIVNKVSRKVITYGIDNDADIMAQNILYNKNGSEFEVVLGDNSFLVNLAIIGKHNILNCLAAIAICLEIDIKIDVIVKSLKTCTGAKRRLDFRGNIEIDDKKIQVFDDYGHHPSELRAVIESMQKTIIQQSLKYNLNPEIIASKKDILNFIRSGNKNSKLNQTWRKNL